MDHRPTPKFVSRALDWLDNPLTAALLYPRTLDDFTTLVDATWSRRELRTRIVAVQVEDDTATLELDASRGAPVHGGRLALVPSIDGRRVSIDAKVKSETGRRLVVQVPCGASTAVMRWAVHVARRGDVVLLAPPSVDLALDHELVFRKSGVRVEGSTSLPILVQAERAGLKPVAGCRRGVCHRCACTLASGVVRNVQTGEVSSERGAVIRPCVSAPVGAVEVDL